MKLWFVIAALMLGLVLGYSMQIQIDADLYRLLGKYRAQGLFA
jgi:hypothetical protein